MSVIESSPQFDDKVSKATDLENAMLDESSDDSFRYKSNRELEQRIKEDFELYMDTANKVNEVIEDKAEDTPRLLFKRMDKNKHKYAQYSEFEGGDRR